VLAASATATAGAAGGKHQTNSFAALALARVRGNLWKKRAQFKGRHNRGTMLDVDRTARQEQSHRFRRILEETKIATKLVAVN
jgi:hypothetical protein